MGQRAVESFGFTLTGAFRTAMWNDTQCIVHLGDPRLADVGGVRGRASTTSASRPWHAAQHELDADFMRTLMVEAPLSPLRIGRQPESRRPPSARRGVAVASLTLKCGVERRIKWVAGN